MFPFSNHRTNQLVVYGSHCANSHVRPDLADASSVRCPPQLFHEVIMEDRNDPRDVPRSPQKGYESTSRVFRSAHRRLGSCACSIQRSGHPLALPFARRPLGVHDDSQHFADRSGCRRRPPAYNAPRTVPCCRAGRSPVATRIRHYAAIEAGAFDLTADRRNEAAYAARWDFANLLAHSKFKTDPEDKFELQLWRVESARRCVGHYYALRRGSARETNGTAKSGLKHAP